MFGILTPFPGTEIYEEAMRNGVIIERAMRLCPQKRFPSRRFKKNSTDVAEASMVLGTGDSKDSYPATSPRAESFGTWLKAEY